jgi:hypothetical protein
MIMIILFNKKKYIKDLSFKKFSAKEEFQNFHFKIFKNKNKLKI